MVLSPRGPHLKNLTVLECTNEEAKRDGVYVEVRDSRDKLLLDGEIVRGEISAGVDSISDFTGPSSVRYRILED